MWKERRNHHSMLSKQQPKYYDESICIKLSGGKIVPHSDLWVGELAVIQQ